MEVKMRIGRIQNDYSANGFELVKQQKMQFIEICCNYDADADKLIDAQNSVKQLIADTGIDVSSVGRWNHTVNVDGKIDQSQMDRYLRLLDTTIALGAKTFVCGCNFAQGVSLYKNYTVANEFFKALTDHASGSDVKVAIQNCDWNNFIVSPRDWDMVFGENPDLYIKYDPSHAYSRGENYIEQIAQYGNKIAHFHVKGKVKAGKGHVDDPPAGMDDIMWGSVFASLYSVGYDGDLSIEPHSRVWQGELGFAGVEYTREFVKQFVIK